MADTLTPNLKLTNQTEGGNSNSWGSILDANLEEIDDKLGDVTSISTTGGTTTLTDAQEIVNAIRVSGTLVSNATIVFSGRGGSWIVENNTTGNFTVTVKVSGQTGVTIDQGGAALVYCNGTDIDYGNPAASATAEVTVASASTCDILGAASEFIAISGTTTITSFGTGTNRMRFVRATGAFTITHNATSLICPGGYNITTAAGDTFLVIADASSNARIHNYQRAANNVPVQLPVGALMPYAGSSAPSGWLLCYGQDVSRTTYAALYAAIGVTYGVGNGTTTFTLPDLRGRVVAGKDDMGGTSANRLTNQTGGLNGDTLGATGGSETHTLTAAQLPANIPNSATSTSTSTGTVAPTSGQFISTSGGGVPSGTSSTTWGQSTNLSLSITTTTTTTVTINPSGGSAHNNIQPTIILNYIIFAGA